MQGATGATGAAGRSTARTGAGPRGAHTQRLNPTGRNGVAMLTTGTRGLAPVFGASGLPPTSLDSFVVQAGGNADLIYGDEGTNDIPPYFGFDQSHRINMGISGDDSGLTTGHGSMLPNAWGGDEFVQPEGPSMAGSNGGNPYPGFIAPASGALAGLATGLGNSTWAQNHPRQAEVLERDSALYNQINRDYGRLGGNYNQLQSQALAIQNQDLTDAAQNGGYITLDQKAQMDREVGALAQVIRADHQSARIQQSPLIQPGVTDSGSIGSGF